MSHIRNEALRRKLIECAIRHFIQKGYIGANMMEIAAEAGVTRGPLYYYFASKADLYLAAASHVIDEMKARYSEILLPDRPVLDLLREDFDYCLEDRRNFFLAQPDGRGVPDVSAMWNDFCAWLIERKQLALSAAKARGELRADSDMRQMITFIYMFYNGVKQVRSMAETLDCFDHELLDYPTEAFVRVFALRFCAEPDAEASR